LKLRIPLERVEWLPVQSFSLKRLVFSLQIMMYQQACVAPTSAAQRVYPRVEDLCLHTIHQPLTIDQRSMEEEEDLSEFIDTK
jgi:hypothetical protein